MTTTQPLSADAQAQLFTEARTVSRFSDEPVTHEQLTAIYDLAKFGPTALNSQPLRILEVSGERTERLLPHVAEGNVAKVRSAPVTLVLAYDEDFHEALPEVFPHAPGLRDRFGDRAARVETARFNASIQIGYLLLAVRALGLAAGPLGGFDNAALDADLLAGTSWRSLLLVNVGHPAAEAAHPRLPRLAADRVLRAA